VTEQSLIHEDVDADVRSLLFLGEEPDKEHPEPSDAAGQASERLPGPFIEDEAMSAPGDLARSGQEIACLYLPGVTRQPDLFPSD
jgi:hypothetical protein